MLAVELEQDPSGLSGPWLYLQLLSHGEMRSLGFLVCMSMFKKLLLHAK